MALYSGVFGDGEMLSLTGYLCGTGEELATVICVTHVFTLGKKEFKDIHNILTVYIAQ